MVAKFCVALCERNGSGRHSGVLQSAINSLEDVLRNSQRQVAPPLRRAIPADGEHAWLALKKLPHAVVGEFQHLGDLLDREDANGRSLSASFRRNRHARDFGSRLHQGANVGLKRSSGQDAQN